MIVASRSPLTFRGIGGLGAPNTESHPDLVAAAQKIYSAAGFAASCSETVTPWAPGKAYYNRLCSLDGGPQSHAVDPIAENYGGVLPAYMVQQIKQEVAAERAPGSAVVVPQGIYTVDTQGKPTTTSFLDALVASGVSRSVAASVAQPAAPPVPLKQAVEAAKSTSDRGRTTQGSASVGSPVTGSGGGSGFTVVPPVPPQDAVPPAPGSPLESSTTGSGSTTAPAVFSFDLGQLSSVPWWAWAGVGVGVFVMLRGSR